MNNSFFKFKERIKEAKIGLIIYAQEEKKPSFRNVLEQQHFKMFCYSGIVITIYGALEAFVSELASSYVRILYEKKKNYNLLPDVIQTNYLYLFLSNALKRSEREKDYNMLLDAKHGLGLLFNDSQQIIHEVFKKTGPNCKIDVINDIFKKIGLHDMATCIQKQASFKNFCNSEELISKSNNFSLLCEIVDRRNDVAHGNIEEIVSSEILDIHINYIMMLGEAIYSSLRLYSLQHFQDFFNQIGSPKRIFGSSTAAFSFYHHVSLDQPIVEYNPETKKYRIGQIIGIRDSQGTDQPELSSNDPISLRCNGISMTQDSIYYLPFAGW